MPSRKYLLLFIALLFLLFPLKNIFAAETLKNTGLINKNVWYSKDPFYTGDRIRIYSVVFNGSEMDLRGRVNFYDNGSLLCTTEFSSLAGRISEIWCDWIVGGGKHGISIKITNPKGSLPGQPEQDVILSNGDLSVIDERVIVAEPVSVVETIPQKVDLPKPIEDKPEVINASEGGILTKIKDLFFDYSATSTKPISSSYSDVPEQTVSAINRSNGSNIKNINSRAVSIANLSTLDHSVKIGQDIIASIENKTPFSFLANINKKFNNFVNNTAVLSSFKGRILAAIGAATIGDNRPIVYLMSFFYILTKLIMESPIVLSLISLLFLWKVVEFYIRRRRKYYR
ncbi:MAG: hypothetical protein HY225_00315 [Candidatus Vogelbacteria bacterium]|nr:hypothetical protein [Candidatus Vogelbacteria bacterium]